MENGESYNNFDTSIPSSFDAPQYLNPEYLFVTGSRWLEKIFKAIFSHTTSEIIHTLAFGFSIFFITLICYCVIRMFEIREKEHKHLHHEIEEYAHHQAERERKKWNGEGAPRNERWTAVLNHLFSENLNDWKLAIIEADSMLEILLGQLGFPGNSIGERLKSADRDKFPSLTTAWEVHTVRNRIAHEGLGFTMSHHEAKRIIALYEQMFREFGYI